MTATFSYYIVDITYRHVYDNDGSTLRFVTGEPITDKLTAVREYRRLTDFNLNRRYALVRGNICRGVSFCSMELGEEETQR